VTDDDAGASRRSVWWIVGIVVVVLVVAGGGIAAWSALRSNGVTSELGPEGVIVRNVPDLAPSSTTVQGATVDGITCRRLGKQPVKYHVHVYVTVFVNGNEERLPAGIGIARPFTVEHLPAGPFYEEALGGCLYWLHTHSFDGIVHVEAPRRGTFTLGQLFDVWHQPLTATQAGPAKGAVVVFENGRRLADPRSAQLVDHGVIQIDVGSPVVPFKAFTFKVTGSCGQGSNCKPKAKSS